MKRSKPAPPSQRDQKPTPFGQILEQLLDLEPRAAAAALVDSEGEAVDYAGKLSTFYTKVAAAHLRAVLDEIEGVFPQGHGRPLQVVVRGQEKSFLVRPLRDGYALVVVLKRRAFGLSARAIAVSERSLSSEAGWPLPRPAGPIWYPATIETGPPDRRRPLRMKSGSIWEPVDVLGSVVGLNREKGYRCRLATGAELTLVREPAGIWYADELLESVEAGDA
jgi:hypothetical protein